LSALVGAKHSRYDFDFTNPILRANASPLHAATTALKNALHFKLLETVSMTANLRRFPILTFAAVSLFFALGAFGVAAPSERIHILAPLLWLLDRFALRAERKPLRAPQVLAFGGGSLLLFWAYSDLAQSQAREYGARADWREAMARLWLTFSLCVLYGVWSAATLFLLRRNLRVRRFFDSPRAWPLRGLRIAFALAVFAPYVFTSLSIHRTKITNASNPQSEFGLEYQDVSFRAGDGVRLSGWFIPAKNSRKTVLVCHGVGANKNIFIGVVPFLHRAGCNVLMFDFRGHGQSQGHTVSYGVFEARDVQAAMDYLRSRGLNDVAGYAFSMGGAALLYAVPDVRFRGVVLDSTFARFAPVALAQMPVAARLKPAMLRISDFYSWLELGIFLGDIAPRKYIAQISPRPLLIIHGTADSLVPPDQTRENFAAAREPKELWLVPGATHCRPRLKNIPVYEKRVTAFLNRCFAG